MDKETLGKKLREYRIESGIKWDMILDKMQNEHGIKIARSTIYGYENGRNYPDPNILVALYKIYGHDDLMEDFSSGTPPLPDGEFEKFVLYEDDYSPENWAMVKNFLALIPTNEAGSEK